MRRTVHLRIISLFFFIIFSAAYLPVFVRADSTSIQSLQQEIDKRKNAISELEKSISKVKDQIAQQELASISLQNQMNILDQHVTETSLNIKLTQEKLSTLELELTSLGGQIDNKSQHLDKQKIILASLLRTMSYDEGKNNVQILATYQNFSDFYNRVQYLRTVEKNVIATTQNLKHIKSDLVSQEQDTQVKKDAVSQLQAELLQQKTDLQEQMNNKQRLLTETKHSEAVYGTLLNNLKKQYRDTENEISSDERLMRKKLAEEDRLNKLNRDRGAGGVFSWPTGSRYITAYFHDPNYPFRNVFEHDAIDIRATFGTPIHAAASGYVGQAKHCTTASCYAYVMIIHAEGMSTVYGHLSRIDVAPEQFVARGDIIGYSGGTPGTIGAGPFVTGPHLHFEVRKNGIPINPLDYLPHDF